MPHRTFAGLPAVLALLAGCAVSSTYPADAPPLRAASDLPERFVTESAGLGCLSPMYDPRDSTRIVLRQAQRGEVGDYEVPPGRYGVGQGEWLRLECPTGRPLGVVPARK